MSNWKEPRSDPRSYSAHLTWTQLLPGVWQGYSILVRISNNDASLWELFKVCLNAGLVSEFWVKAEGDEACLRVWRSATQLFYEITYWFGTLLSNYESLSKGRNAHLHSIKPEKCQTPRLYEHLSALSQDDAMHQECWKTTHSLLRRGKNETELGATADTRLMALNVRLGQFLAEVSLQAYQIFSG